jgi:hypothetical protein
MTSVRRRTRHQCRTRTAGAAITVGDAEASPSTDGLLARIPALQGDRPRATGTQPPVETTGSWATGRTELPRTGADLDRLVVAGLAATAGGAALVLWSAEAKSASSRAADSTSKTSPVTGDRPDAFYVNGSDRR